MKILLVNPPCGERTIGMRHLCLLEPLNLEQVGAGVSSEHDVRLVDMQARPEDLTTTLAEFQPDVCGAGTEMVRMGPAKEVLRIVKQHAPQCVTVIGGYHPSIFPEDFDDPAIDLIVRGEGYHPFRAICQAVDAGHNRFGHIPGLRIRTADGFEDTAPYELPTSLDDIPPPDRRLTARYRKYYYHMFEPHVTMMRTSYGCKGKCNFCSGALVYGRHFVPRDPRAMFDEIRSIDAPFVKFADNGSFSHVESMGRLGRMLIDAKVKKRYFSFSRADAVLDHPEVFEIWKRAGLDMLFLGIESLDDKALDRMHKGASHTRMEKAIEILEDLKIPIMAGFVIAPDATERDFQRFDEYVAGHPIIHFAEFTPLTPFPGTAFYEEQRQNIITTDPQLYDLQHFVLKTALPQEELYRLMLRSYRKIAYRYVWQEHLWMPIVGLRRGKWRMFRGAMANTRAFKKAHLDIAKGAGESLLTSTAAASPRRPAFVAIEAGSDRRKIVPDPKRPDAVHAEKP